MSPYLLAGIGGIAGANLRFLISTLAAKRFGVEFPYGTLAINLSGSALLGFFLTFLPHHFGGGHNATLLIGTGFLGAYTTFSTFSYETVALLQQRNHAPALVNATLSVCGGLAGCALGMLLATLVNRHF